MVSESKKVREILFRGKREDNGEWIKGSFWDEIPGELGAIAHYGSCIFHHVDLETVGQFTGLTDKNGKKIFDGDIVRHWNGSDDGYDTGRVFWDAAYCGWRRTTDGTFHNRIVDTYRMSLKCCYEVIGNIHDNPELLEGCDG